MSQTPCKILSVLSPNQLVILTQTQKVVILGNGVPDFPNMLTQNQWATYIRQLSLVGKNAIYSQKGQTVQVEGQSVFENIQDGSDQILVQIVKNLTQNDQIAQEFIKLNRNKTLEGIIVSVTSNQLNVLTSDFILVTVIPNQIYIDEFGIQDQGYLKLMQKEWIGKRFQLTFKGTQILQIPIDGVFNHIVTIKADLVETNQVNPELSNQFYNSLISSGYAYLTDLGMATLTKNAFQILFQCQEEAKQQRVGLWKNGELDRRLLNSVSSQTIGTVIEIVEANQYLIKTATEIITIKLDRIFIEGLEAKEFARRMLIGKKVHVLQLGSEVPSYSIQIVESNTNVEEELIANGWALVKENHPHVSKYKIQLFHQLNQQAKAQKLGQYNLDLNWRIDDQTDAKYGKNVNENVWGSIQRELQNKKQQIIQIGAQGDYQIECVVDKITDQGFHIMIPQFHSIVNFKLANIVDLVQFSHSFPNILAYHNARKQFTYELLMQRTVYIQAEAFNIKDNMLTGKMFNKKNSKTSDVVLDLLRNGYTFLDTKADYYAIYNEAQSLAQAEKKGVWNEPYAPVLLDMTFTKSNNKTVKESTIQKLETSVNQVIISEIIDCTEFYIRKNANKDFDKIEELVQTAEIKNLPKPVKKGTLCLARFYDDNKLYRAQVIQAFKNDQFLVKFIDYGNEDQVAYPDLGYLPAELACFPKQAQVCGLSYLRLPNSTHTFGEESTQIFRDMVWDQLINSKVNYVGKDGVKNYVTLSFPDMLPELEYSINAKLLQLGVGRIEDRILYNPLKALVNLQEEAKRGQKGLWEHDDQLDNVKMLYEEFSQFEN